MTAKKVRGRPEYRPTPQTRRRVAIAAGAGMSHEQIAIALEISRQTLAKHFERELSIGAYRKRMDVVEALHKAANKGSVAAAKAYMALTPAAAAPPVPKGDEAPKEPKPVVLGKKEQAQADATTAQVGTDWETLLPPAATAQ